MKRIQFYNLYILIFVLCCSSTIQSQTRSEDGEWGDPIPFGIVPVAVANLPDGRLITWSSQFRNTFVEIGDGMTYTEIFDPTLNGGLGQALGETVTQTDHDMFCPGINNLADGRILSAGGSTSERTSIYDPITGVWSRASDMNIPRGYQGNTTLSNGAVFTVGGSWSGGAGNNGGKAAELWTPESGWINLPNITGEAIYTSNDLFKEDQGDYRVDNHVWLWPAPNGKLFHAGPSEMMHWIDPDVSGGAIEDAGIRGDDTYSMKGTTVMFDIGKILKVGGAESYGASSMTTTPAKDNSYVIDINVPYGQTPNVISAGNLAFSRTMHNSTVLPTGQVLVTGGLDHGAVFSDVGARYEAELYTPSPGSGPGTWETVATMEKARTYHSVAILLTDGRVFVGGGGLCDGTLDCVNHFSAEIYSPPYLFNPLGDLATRPSITSVTGNTLGDGPYNNNPLVNYGDVLTVDTDVAVASFSLVRFSAATHSTNNEQRRIPLATTLGTTHNLTIPDRNLLPPGYYMLFALDANGTPSVSKTLRIGTAEPLQIPNTNLVVDMKFNENSGATAADNSVYNNNANIVEHDDNGNIITNGGNYNWTTGIIDGAIEFNGLEHHSNALIDIPSSPSLQTLDDQITVMSWAYRNSAGSTIPDTGKVANVGLFSHDYVSTLFFGFHNTMYKWAFITDNGPVDLYAGRAPMDTWVHMAATYDGNTAKLYANGKLIAWKELAGTIPFKDDGSLQSHFTSSGFYDERTAANLPEYAVVTGITDEINGKIDELKVFNKVLGESEIKEYYQQGINTGNPNVVNCDEGDIIAQYRIGASGTWLTGNSLTIQEGGDIYLRAVTPSNQYYVTTPQENGPTFNSSGSSTYEYQIDTEVFPYGNPERNNGLVDITNQGQFVMTTADGCTAVFDLKVTVIDETDGCPNQLVNEDNGITLPKGTSSQVEIAVGSPDNTNGSDCALRLVNTDDNELYARHEIELDLTTLGINVGDEILVSLDADGTDGVPRIEVNQDNLANSALIDHTYGTGWTNFEDTFIVPSGISSLNIWLYTNYASNIAGTVFYDNLTIVNLSQNGGNTPPVAAIIAVPTNGSAPLEVNFDGSDSTDDSDIASYSWDFGDGTTATGINVDKTFIYSGTYNVVLTVTANDGGTDTEAIEITSSGAPIANIVATPQIGDTPLDVSFDASGSSGDNAIVSYAWDYGDGIMGSGITSSHIYTAIGNFTAKLTITDSAGLTDTGNILITVSAPDNTAPTAVAAATPLSGETPLLVDFDASASTDDNGIFSYSWDFGDGTANETGSLISHTYTDEGTYNAILTVTDAEGLMDTETIEIVVSPTTVTNLAPTALAIASPLTGSAPLLVDFDASGSSDDNGISSYSWDFGDGSAIATGILISHTYTSEGTFDAVLTVTDDEGLTDTSIIEIIVTPSESGNIAPVALATATPLSGEAPLVVDFDAIGSSDDNEIISYSWNFGDGSANTTGINTTHTYGAVGDYNAQLTVIDAEGLTDTFTVEITVSPSTTGNLAPIAVASATPLIGEAPLLVNFDASDSSDDNEIVTYSWNFDNGSTTGSGIVASHTYTEEGIYEVILTVTDEEGLSDIITLEINVIAATTENQAPVAIATADPLNSQSPLTVNFDATASSDDNEIISYSWNFGDGSSVGTGIETSHTFETEGIYNVILTVTDTEGLTDTVGIEITVTTNETTNLAPVALATADTLNGETPLLVTFDASGSSDDKGISSYAWDYGDGITGNGITTTHTFNAIGTYEVTLTLTDEEGVTATANLTITVTATKTTLNNVDLKDILVYPNPVGNENLNINLSDFMDESIALGFYDSYGKLVFQNIVNEDHPEEIAIDVSFLSNGLYLIEITRVETNEFTYKKIIKAN
ncbi:PKD domain-containing protein [Maribacter sp. 1_MG-2023]|uniref:PKD domain-containing protein n=1 Tax=Maribacter sp. 1_MG-2023 TaxID=3062677 RepID=UPI0026E3E5A8|nr:PKD domain-containing protein [Maribacter sp. 1_MG-2023]MDO6472171.1 PKD domain-containing protein [Maribacter sp. 1_MG-2023]